MNEVHLQQLDAQPTLSIRATIATGHLRSVLGERLKALAAHLQALALTPAGPPYVRYHTFSNTETDMEVGVPTGAPAQGAGDIVSGELPAGPAISTVHLGPHDTLGQAYARLSEWQREQGRRANGPGWEVYEWIDLAAYPPAAWLPPAQWRAELVQPVQA